MTTSMRWLRDQLEGLREQQGGGEADAFVVVLGDAPAPAAGQVIRIAFIAPEHSDELRPASDLATDGNAFPAPVGAGTLPPDGHHATATTDATPDAHGRPPLAPQAPQSPAWKLPPMGAGIFATGLLTREDE